MNALAPYLFRVYNKELDGRREERYSTLDKLGTYDLYYILKDFIQQKSATYSIIEDTQHVYMFDNMVFDDTKRVIYGLFNVGTYGIKTDIIDINTNKIDFHKTQKNSEIIRHYVHYFIPKGVNEAMAFMHSYRGTGVKTLFFDLFSEFFKLKTGLVIQMNPLSYDKAMNAWMDGPAKELRLTKFDGLSDIADQVKKLGHHEQELVIKPKRNRDLGTLKDYFKQGSDQIKAIEVMGEHGSQVKTVIEINGKRRTFSVGRNKTSALCEIDITEDEVELDGGLPTVSSMNTWVTGIINEYIEVMYPGVGVGKLS